ncbi:MAG: hypothetical protein H5T97_07750, partial [Firmicutes bacterium]|nr:hypothetical protein [Bacillota bacterium]
RDPVLVLGGEGWHPGVIGIVAARLVEYFYRPVLLVALEGDRGRGSGRSVPGFHLFRALGRCREWLTEFGGHAGAAGFTLPAGNVESLRRAMGGVARELGVPAGGPRLDVDAVIRLEELRADVVRACASLAPFGYGNPEPLLLCPGASVLDGRRAGRSGAHLKMRVRQGSRTVEAIGFGLGDRLEEAGGTRDLVFTPELARDAAGDRLELRVVDFAPAAGRDNRQAGNGVRLPEALFRSDFVLRRLRELRSSAYGAAVPEASGAPPDGVPGDGPRAIVDRRDWPHRPSLVAELAGAGMACALVAGGAHEALFWWRYLRRRAGISGAGLYHPRLPLRRGTPAVTTPDGLALLEERPARVVLCYVPFEPGEWEAVLRAASGGTLVLAWNGSDLRRGADELEALAPGRGALGLIYRGLRGPRRTPFSVREMVVRLREEGLARAGPHTVEVGLRILSELELVRYTWESTGVVACRPLPHRTRRDLNESLTYRWAQRWKAEARRWQEILWQQRSWPEC